MKKIILLLIILVSGVSNAQYPVWVNSFDSAADLEGWTFHDLNNNGNNWVQGANWRNGEAGTEQVLRYTTFPLSGDYYPNADTENDWIISPAINLSSASGTIQLAIYWNKVYSNQNNASGRLVFISTSPDLAGFQQLQTQGNQGYYFVTDDVVFPANPNEFAESILDVSTFAGSTIYIGLLSTNDTDYTFQIAPINIDRMGIFASTLGVEDLNAPKTHTKIVQNPVASTLQLQLNPALEPTTTAVKVYNIMGQEVFTAPYSNQIEVSALAAGAYIMHVTNGAVVEKLKFIKM
ncbi:T9SS type A sorting domain-containing protein [Flavobacterium sp. RHBU_24]|uniref:T9SS type A sorting domain-containing protein n=1 Tax=Flavobacterium sp. RHBU_24 TaxID=3391185 RepID=UPI0039847B1D